jgi:transmembrane sensor
MDNSRIIYLYEQYRMGLASEKELEELQSLLSSGESGDVLRESWAESWDSISEQDIRSLKLERDVQIFEAIVLEPQGDKKVRRLWPRIAVAAAVATLIFGAGLFYYSNQNVKTDQPAAVVAGDVAPGKVGATLTLASGRKIVLSEAVDGELAKEAGVLISKSKDGKLVYELVEGSGDANKINVLSTSRGETYDLRLPDGSLVALNAASSLSYPANFTRNKERRVELTGEGYFEVAKDKLHPFVVSTAGQEVEVLGTHFNVNAYSDEAAVTTTLLEGSVKVHASAETGLSASAVLKPGEQSSLDDNTIKVASIDTELAVAWKNNNFMFEASDIKSVMRVVERWYNVEVKYEGALPTEKFGGAVSRFDNISSVLKILESTGGAHFKVEGRTVTVTR